MPTRTVENDVVNQVPASGGYLVSASMPAEGMAPEAVLRSGLGGPRGFWAREGRWFAHIGAAATVEARMGEDPFEAVWTRARSLFGRIWTDPEGGFECPPVRFFGGFSFSEGHRPEGVWEGFPPAYFVLPSLELIGGREGRILTLRRLVAGGRDPSASMRSIKEELFTLTGALSSAAGGPAEGPEVSVTTHSELDEEGWARMVERSLAAIGRGELSKVVMARAVSASPSPLVDPVAVGMNLWRENPGSHVFLFEPIPGHALVGAAPETVATVKAGVFRATSVAGSVERGRSREEQEAFAAELLASEKDRREHLLCVRDMVERLSAIAQGVDYDPDPRVLTVSVIQHLETAITADLNPGETVISALRALHPTPAVCGFPRDEALEVVLAEEASPRGWYAGPVGWFDGGGNGVFVPALRSAIGVDGKWRLFAGAGIVGGSDPKKEWKETLIKLQPVLRALGNGKSPASHRLGGEGGG